MIYLYYLGPQNHVKFDSQPLGQNEFDFHPPVMIIVNIVNSLTQSLKQKSLKSPALFIWQNYFLESDFIAYTDGSALISLLR